MQGQDKLNMSSLKVLRLVDDRTDKLLSGYIRNIERIIKADNIPICIKDICLICQL